jgi:hypothetical protein
MIPGKPAGVGGQFKRISKLAVGVRNLLMTQFLLYQHFQRLGNTFAKI